jgi:1,2-phenylacetyl-CoA epoxidase catalytic subunit
VELIALKVSLPADKYELLTKLAEARREEVSETLARMVTERLEEEMHIQHGRRTMLELGEGLGEGKPSHDAACRHDDYLYGRAT